MRVSVAVAAALAVCVGCANPEGQTPPPAGTGGATSGTGGATSAGTGGGPAEGSGGSAGMGGVGGADGSVNPLGRARCKPPDGMSGTPQTIEDAVALLNALPKPTGVPCFVEALDRPLGAYATNSIFSLQPAVSNQSPRVFLRVGRMWISVAIDGTGSDLIEFGELLDDGLRSLKGELKLPVSDVVPATMPFDRVVEQVGGTTCGVCHRQESLDHLEGTSQIFSSVAFRPIPNTRVSLDYVRDQAASCDWQTQPDRCDLLSALFGGGPVQDAEFPMAMQTFF
jgi:hypothetical protein